MLSGPLRDRLEVQVATTAKSPSGQALKTWATTRTMWAQLRGLAGREYLNSGQTKAEVTHLIRTRYFPGLLATHRLKLGERIFQIVWIDDTANRHRELMVQVREQVQPAP